MSAEPLVEACGVTFRVRGRELLTAVDLAVHPAEILSLIGPNGAGKTTLARLLLGVTKPTVGQVRRRPGLVIGYVPQRLMIDPILPLTVERFLALGLRQRRLGGENLAEVGAAHLAKAAMHELSGGEFQRVLLARALARQPQLLVLDEPAQGVDLAGQLDLYALVEAIRDRRGCGVLLISHDLHVVMAATDRVVCLNRHVCCAGRPEAVSQHPEYISLFGRRAARALAVYTHEHDHAHDLHGEVIRRPAWPDEPAAGGGAKGGDDAG
jgi:zinc transport system ATP-binding protein